MIVHLKKSIVSPTTFDVYDCILPLVSCVPFTLLSLLTRHYSTALGIHHSSETPLVMDIKNLTNKTWFCKLWLGLCNLLSMPVAEYRTRSPNSSGCLQKANKVQGGSKLNWRGCSKLGFFWRVCGIKHPDFYWKCWNKIILLYFVPSVIYWKRSTAVLGKIQYKYQFDHLKEKILFLQKFIYTIPPQSVSFHCLHSCAWRVG